MQQCRISQEQLFLLCMVNAFLYVLLASVAACGGVYNFSSGIVNSPAYSYTDYPNNLYCLYTVTVREDRVIQIKYVSKIYILRKSF